MALPPEFLDELKLRLPAPDVVGKKVRLQRSGGELKGLCPFHKEKTPSFYCYDDHFHCFGCGEHGSVIDFVMKTENLEFREAISRLAQEAGLPMPQETAQDRERQKRRATLADVTEQAAAFFERALRMPEGAEALDYLRRRGLSDHTIKRFRLGFAPDGKGVLKTALAKEGIDEALLIEAGLAVQPDDPTRLPYDRFRGRVMFPITDRGGRVIAFGARLLKGEGPKYLNSPETPLFHKGRNLYALAQAKQGVKDHGTIIVAEGYMDVIALHQAGFTNAVAPLGTAITEEQIQLLWRIAPDPIVCLDGDAAGERAAVRAAERALPILKPGNGLRFATVPEGEDPDSLIQAQGRSAFEAVLENSEALSELIWRTESGGTLPGTPEARAALDKRLKDKLRAIQDATVRGFFADSFKERMGLSKGDTGTGDWSGGGRPWKGRKAKWRDEPDYLMRFAAGDPNARALEADPGRAAILIRVILNFPQLLDEVEEALGALRFSDRGYDDVRQALLLLQTSDSVLDSSQVSDHLTQHGYAPVLSRLLRATTDVAFAHPNAGFAQARRGWWTTLNDLRSGELERELREAQTAFGRDPSDANNRWLLQVQRMMLEQKTVDVAFD